MDTESHEPVPRRFTRRAESRWIAGVASGIADAAAVPTWVVRLGFVLATPFGGVGPVLYALCWWLMPRRDLPASAARRMARRYPQAPALLGLGLLVFGGLLLAAQLGWARPPLIAAAVLIVIGVLLFMREPRLGSDGGTPVPVTAPDTASFAGTQTDLPPASLPTRRTPRKRRERSFLGPLTLGLGLMIIAVGALLDLTGSVAFESVDAAGLLLLVLGLGMAVGGFIGRARWLVAPVVLLLPITLVATVLHVDFDDGFGERIVEVRTLESPVIEQLGVGELTIDLTGVPRDASGSVRARVGGGMLILNVPDDMRVLISGEIGFGTVEHVSVRLSPRGLRYLPPFPGPNEASFGQSLDWSGQPPAGAAGTIVIEADVSVGGVQIVHVRREEPR